MNDQKEIQAEVVRLKSKIDELWGMIFYFCEKVDPDMPWPPGVGYWDGITARQNAAEGQRRFEAKV